MTTLEIILLTMLIFVTALYVYSKFWKGKTLKTLVDDVIEDSKGTLNEIGNAVVKVKDIILDKNFRDAIKKFVLEIEEKNIILKENNELFLTGEEKKKEVFNKIRLWILNLTGSTVNALDFVDENENKINLLIEEYVEFMNIIKDKHIS